MYVNGAEPDPKYYEERNMSDKFSGVIEKLFVKFNEKTKKFAWNNRCCNHFEFKWLWWWRWWFNIFR